MDVIVALVRLVALVIMGFLGVVIAIAAAARKREGASWMWQSVIGITLLAFAYRLFLGL